MAVHKATKRMHTSMIHAQLVSCPPTEALQCPGNLRSRAINILRGGGQGIYTRCRGSCRHPWAATGQSQTKMSSQ